MGRMNTEEERLKQLRTLLFIAILFAAFIAGRSIIESELVWIWIPLSVIAIMVSAVEINGIDKKLNGLKKHDDFHGKDR